MAKRFPGLTPPSKRRNPVRSGADPRLGRGGFRTTQRGRALRRGEAVAPEEMEVGEGELVLDGFTRINRIETPGMKGKWYEATAPAGQRALMYRYGPKEWYGFTDYAGAGTSPYPTLDTPSPLHRRKTIKPQVQKFVNKMGEHVMDEYLGLMEIVTDPRMNPKRRRKNPVKRDKKSGKKLPDVTTNYKRFRVRGPQRFEADSFKTIAVGWAKKSMAVDSTYALSKARKYKGFPRTLPKNTKVVVGRFKANAKGDRPKGKRGDYLAWGIQTILVPKPASKTKRRSNPGPRLMVMNPLPKHIERFRNKLTPAERKEFDAALRRYIKFHGGAYPAKISKVGKAPGKGKRFLVGMGRAVDVGYDADKRFPGSNKEGTPWRHEFKTKNALMATTANGKQILVLNKPGARKGFKVTDWVRG
jgi:hypothetical protein